MIFDENGQNHFFSQILTFIVSKLYSVCFEKFFEVHYMSVCQKLTMLKFVPHPYAASEEAMQLSL